MRKFLQYFFRRFFIHPYKRNNSLFFHNIFSFHSYIFKKQPSERTLYLSVLSRRYLPRVGGGLFFYNCNRLKPYESGFSCPPSFESLRKLAVFVRRYLKATRGRTRFSQPLRRNAVRIIIVIGIVIRFSVRPVYYYFHRNHVSRICL